MKKIMIVLLVLTTLFLAACLSSIPSIDTCGNSICEPDETIFTCGQDCPATSDLKGIEYLGEERAIDWAPGIPGGIPEYPVSINLQAGASASEIQTALNNAPEKSAVKLAAGSYTITSEIKIPSYKVLRGSGVENTKIYCDKIDACITLGNWRSDPDTTVTDGFNLGSTEIYLSDVSDVSVGEYIQIWQDDFDRDIVCGDMGCADWADHVVSQVARVEEVDSSSKKVTLSKPLYYDYSKNLNPKAISEKVVELAGVEDLYLERTVTRGYGNNFLFAGSARCWLDNVWSQYTLNRHVDIIGGAFENEIRNSVFTESHIMDSGGYGVTIEGRSSDNLVENNIFNKLRHGMIISYGAAGNVFGYNLGVDAHGANGWLEADNNVHGMYAYKNLFEGNLASTFRADWTWGTNGPTTVFRNKYTRDSAYVTQSMQEEVSHINIEINQPMMNIIANELGFQGQYVKRDMISVDGDSKNTVYIHKNHDYAHNTLIGDEPVLSGPIPNSLYLKNIPSWWPDEKQWPAYGPEDIGSKNTIPAEDRFNQLRLQGKI